MLTQKPVLLSKYEQPELKNFCCNNNKEYILNFITNKQSEKDELTNYFKMMNQLESQNQNIKISYLKAPSLNIIKNKFINIQDFTKTIVYDEEIIYQFFIIIFNFDNEKPIPKELTESDIVKPSNVYYKKSLPLKEKVELLKKNGYVFSQEMMINIIQKNIKRIKL